MQVGDKAHRCWHSISSITFSKRVRNLPSNQPCCGLLKVHSGQTAAAVVLTLEAAAAAAVAFSMLVVVSVVNIFFQQYSKS